MNHSHFSALFSASMILLALSVPVVGQTNQGFTYDPVGNRLTGSGLLRFTSTNAFQFDPPRALHGDRVNVYGRNFPVGDPTSYSLNFSGTPATIVQVSSRVLTAEVPPGVSTGSIELTLPDATVISLGTILVEGVVITPASADVDYGDAVPFSATVEGATDQTVTWELDGPAGADLGTIDAAGMYLAAPASSPSADFPVIVQATSAELGVTSFALVNPLCGSVSTATPGQFSAGTWASPHQRDCFEFAGVEGQRVTVAYDGDTPARRLRVLDSDGFPLGVAGGLPELVLPSVLLPEDATYRIEVEADDAPSGTYQVWLADATQASPGTWVFPGDGNWSDSSKWSGGVLPGPLDAATIPDYPGTLTITVPNGIYSCAELTCHENLTLTSGSRLTVAGTLQVHETLAMQGGQLIGATIVSSPTGTISVSSSSANIFDSVTLQQELTLLNSSSLRLRNGLTLEENLVFNATAGCSTLRIDGVQTITGTGEIRFTGTSNCQRILSFGANSALTIDAGVTIRGGSGQVGAAGLPVVNRGTIRANSAGDTLTLTRVANQGTLEATNGATLSLAGDWSNAGTLSMNNATVNLDGDFTLAGLGNFTRSGGSVNLLGTLDQSNDTLQFDATTGSWNMNGAEIIGGIIDTADGAGLVFSGSNGNVFDGVHVQGDLTLGASSTLRIRGGLTLDGSITLQAPSGCSTLNIEGAQTVTGSGEIVFAGSSTCQRIRNWSTNASLVVDSGITIRGGSGQIGSSTLPITNLGTIRSEVKGETLSVVQVTNQGTLQAVDGGILTVDGNWSNTGAFTMVDAVVNLDGNFTLAGLGNFVRSGGSVNLLGTLDKGSDTLLFNATTGSWNMNGAEIIGGTIDTANGEGLVFSGSNGNVFDGVTVLGDLTLGSSSTLRLRNGLTLDGSITLQASSGCATLNIEGSETITGSGEIVFAGDSTCERIRNWSAGASLTVDSGITLRGGSAQVGSSTLPVVNLGTIRSEIPGETLSLVQVTNQGTLEAVNGGVLTLGGDWSNTGTFSMVDSVVNLDGTFTLSGLGSFTRSGGTVNLLGTLDKGTDTLLFDTTTGSWNMNGAEIIGGTIDTADGEGLVFSSSSSNVFDGVTVLGDLILGASSALRIRSGLTLDGSITFLPPSGCATLLVEGPQTFTGAGEIVFAGATSCQRIVSGSTGSSLTVDSGITIRGGTGQVGSSTLPVLNLGAIRSEVPGEMLLLTQVSNQGSLEAVNGSTLRLAGDWSNPGAFSMTDSTVDLGGTFTLAGLGSFTRTGGAVNVTGTLDNTGEVLLFDASTGSWTLSSGEIVGGSIDTADGEGLSFTSSGSNILDGVTIVGDITLNNASRVNSQNGLTINGTLTYAGANSCTSLGIDGNQTIDGTGEIIFAGASSCERIIPVGSTTMLTLGADLTVRGNGASIGAGSLEITNLGTIRVEQAGDTMTCHRVFNQGLMECVNGSTLLLATTWSNSGVVSVDASDLILDGSFAVNDLGTISRNAGAITLRGSLDATGDTLFFNAASGSWIMSTGEIIGGTIATADGQGLLPNGQFNVLDGVTLDGDLTLASNSRISLKNGFTLNGTVEFVGNFGCTNLAVQDQMSIVGTGEIVFAGTGACERIIGSGASSQLTIGSGITIRGNAGTVGFPNLSIINDGTIRSDTPGAVIQIYLSENHGVLEAAAGSLSILTPWTNSGSVVIDAGSSVACLDDFDLTSTGTLEIEISGASAGQFGQLTTTQLATLAGTLTLTNNGYSAVLGETIPIITSSTSSGTFGSTVGTPLGGGLFFDVLYAPTGVSLEVSN